MSDSSIPKFHEKTREEKLKALESFSNLSRDDIQILKGAGGINFEQANNMVENAIGIMSYPLGIATNFKINDKDYLIPMVIEEPSVIAAASKAAKIARKHGGFTMEADESYSVGQVQVVNVDIKSAISNVMEKSKEILVIANSKSKTLSKMGKGAKEVSCKEIVTESGSMLIVEILIDVGDAMGANVTNTMCEAIAPLIEKITGGRVILKILSNYSTKRLVKGKAVFGKEELGGEDIVNNIILAYQFAANDPYRAVTHNKGIMNGIIAVANSTGQDTRAIEAAAHAYASRCGSYTSLTKWKKNKDGNLVGEIEVPMSVGIVGGIVNVHPMIKTCVKILGVTSARELACIIGAAGLAQNLSAIRALASEGIQKGHMKLHAQNIAASAGVPQEKMAHVINQMIGEGNISVTRAKEILENL
ncbi:3-hydroxy-3-methylglutaryl-coenzyme A reductase [Nitrosotalea devaniterrae]|uniref:3-hydroxy-3-methylglutaryl coenzyme A reductase n=1 Tax=Nitrosotalea devaniterrae TaxID=1078905 RepID=A0A128A5Q0_9ARCH|nr:3-hydroxy-3-methylglutaryl-coenzyme A reductase [Candidatus Nitrosotalea devanaterra]